MSNRLYADNTTQKGSSQVYRYDNLHRLKEFEEGLIAGDKSDIQGHWQRRQQDWTLDATGNQTSVQGGHAQSSHDKANQITTRKVKGDQTIAKLMDDFSSSTTAGNWAKPGSGDSFDINATNAGHLTMTAVAADTIDGAAESQAQGIVLWGEQIGPAQLYLGLRLSASAPSGSEAGVVFGYKSGEDYWLQAVHTDQSSRIYHVEEGVRTLVNSTGSFNNPYNAVSYAMRNQRRQLAVPNTYALADGYPSGKVGLYTNSANTKFEQQWLWDDGQSKEMAGRWINFSGEDTAAGRVKIDTAVDRLHLGNQIQGFRPVLLKGLRLQKFQSTFSMRRVGSTAAEMAFAFNAADQDDYDFLRIRHSDTKTAPTGRTQPDGAGQTAVAETKTNANMPALTSTSVLWVRVTHSGTTVTVKCADSEAGLSSAADCYSSSALRTTGGMLGFRPLSSTAQIDDLTIKSYNPSTSSFDVIEQQEFFTLDANGYAEETLAHDANGNLSYDGVHQYRYDAWNRLVKIAKGYRDAGNTLQSGQTFETIRYDGRGRRISKAVTGTGSWDATYHYYYDGDSLVETRNGSNQVLKQQVWGVEYIDELIQISVNDDPDDATENLCETSYWAMQDANYNVLGIVDAAGILKERYEYTPYGQRVVYFSSGVNDPGCYAPTLASRRVTTTLGAMPYGLNEFGHQGLMHDEESQLVYNRARYLHPVLGRFTSADLLGYVDGMSLYEYVRSGPTRYVDPRGWYIETVLDVISTGKSAYDLITDPSWGNAGYLAWDIGAIVVPLGPGSYAAKIPKELAEKAAKEAAEKAAKEAAEKAGKCPTCPIRDASGRVHGDLPDHVPDNWTREQLEESAEELRESLAQRQRNMDRYGEHGPHRERMRQEEDMLRQIEKKLSGS